MQNLKISVSKQPKTDGVVSVKKTSIRERILRKLLGPKQRVMILVPGDSVKDVVIAQAEEGGGDE